MNTCAFNREMAERWHLNKPPARPSAGDVKIYQSFMRQPARTLLLGATPEIRSLARQHGHALTSVDVDDRVYRGLESLVTWPAGEKEEFVCADWLQMDLGKEFDLVIGDGSINMIPLPIARDIPAACCGPHEAWRARIAARLSLWVEPRLKTPEGGVQAVPEVQGDVYTVTKGPFEPVMVQPRDG